MLNSENQIFQYNGSPISFQKGNSVMVNATEMAKPFGKLAKDWLSNKSTFAIMTRQVLHQKRRRKDFSLRLLLYSVIDFPFAELSILGLESLSLSSTSIVPCCSAYFSCTSAFATAGTRALMSSSSFHSLRICS